MTRTQNNEGRHRVGINDPVYSGRNFRSCWEFVLRHGGNTEGFFSGLNIPTDRILDENEWFNIRVATKIWKNYRACLHDYNMCDNYLLGLEALQTPAYGVAIIASQLSSIKYIVKKVPKLVSTVSKIDLLDVIALGRDHAVIGYKIHEGFDEYLDSSFTNQFLGTFAGIPTIHHMPPAEVREVASCIDIFKKFSHDFSEFGHRIECTRDIIYLDGKRVGRWIKIGNEQRIHPIVENQMKGETCVLWEKDVVDKTKLGREVIIARKGDLYNCSRSLFCMKWQNAPLAIRVKKFLDHSSRYVVALSKSKDDLVQKASLLQETARILEERVEERTRELRETQTKLIELEKRTLESRITGGFAHEMRNALSGAQLELASILNYRNQGRSISEKLNDSAQSLFTNISSIHEIFNIPRDEAVLPILAQISSIEEIAEHLSATITGVSEDIDRGLSITNQIRNYAQMSKLKRGDQTIELVSMLKGYGQRYGPLFEKSGIDYRVEGLTSAFVKAEKTHMYSIFSNLVLNAKDALDESEEDTRKVIRISVARENTSHERFLIVRVTDNGPGIPEHHQREIFEPFFSTKPSHGTGLGLGIVERLVHLYGGKIDLQSVVGDGTTFKVTLPGGENGRIG